MKCRVLGLSCLLVVLGAFLCAGATIENQFDATCRIATPDRVLPDGRRGHEAGTGCAFLADGGYVAVLTSAHVVQNCRVVTCEFWRAGHLGPKFPGQVLVCDRSIDAAAVLVPRSCFGGVAVQVIAFADTAPAPGDPITSVGCANASWATAFVGHVTRYDNGEMYFLPPPADGRSGSALCDHAGRLVGMIRSRTAQNGGEGGAVDLSTLRNRLYSEIRTAVAVWRPEPELLVQCGPNGCGPSGDEADDGLFRRGRVRGGPNIQIAPQVQGNPWAALTAPKADLGPIVTEIQGLRADLRTPTPAAPATPAGPDPATVQALQQLGEATKGNASEINALRQEVPKVVAAAVQPVADQVGKIEGVVGPLLRLHNKLEADAEAGGLKGKIAQRVLDVAEGGAPGAGGDTVLRHILIVTGIVVGLGLVLAFGVIHLLRTGKSPGRELLDARAKKHPDDPKLQRMAAKADAFDAAVLAKLPHGLGLPGLAVGGATDVAQQLKEHFTALLTPAPSQRA